jgi:hypothetical protein
MKILQITADWILSNFCNTVMCSGDGTVNIFCDSCDIKWIMLALDDIVYEYGEEVDENGEFQAEFHFKLNDVAIIAPIFCKDKMEINNVNAKRL